MCSDLRQVTGQRMKVWPGFPNTIALSSGVHPIDPLADRQYSRLQNDMSATFAQVEQEAMTLSAEERARLADRLWDSLPGPQHREVGMSPQLERLLDEGLQNLGGAKTTDELRHS
jgi:hypothetical protein